MYHDWKSVFFGASNELLLAQGWWAPNPVAHPPLTAMGYHPWPSLAHGAYVFFILCAFSAFLFFCSWCYFLGVMFGHAGVFGVFRVVFLFRCPVDF